MLKLAAETLMTGSFRITPDGGATSHLIYFTALHSQSEITQGLLGENTGDLVVEMICAST